MLAVSSSCVRLSHSVMSKSLPPMDCSPPGFSIHGDSPGKNTGVGCHAHLQGIFSTKKSNPLAINTSSLVKFLKIFEFLKNQVVFFSLNFNNPLYILDSSPLSDVSFANIFSQSISFLLIFLKLFFTQQKFLILMNSNLSIISFMDHVFGDISKKVSPYPWSSRFSLIFQECYSLQFQKDTF